jgi:hypothetical protein
MLIRLTTTSPRRQPFTCRTTAWALMLCRSALLNPWSLGRLATSTSNPNHPTTSLRLFAFLVFAPTPLPLILSSPQQIIHRSKAHDITTSPSSLPRFRPNAAPILLLSKPNVHRSKPHDTTSYPPVTSSRLFQVVPPASSGRPSRLQVSPPQNNPHKHERTNHHSSFLVAPTPLPPPLLQTQRPQGQPHDDTTSYPPVTSSRLFQVAPPSPVHHRPNNPRKHDRHQSPYILPPSGSDPSLRCFHILAFN